MRVCVRACVRACVRVRACEHEEEGNQAYTQLACAQGLAPAGGIYDIRLEVFSETGARSLGTLC